MTFLFFSTSQQLIATGSVEGDPHKRGEHDGGDGRAEEVGDVALGPHLVGEHARGKVQQLAGGWSGGTVGGRGEAMLKVQRKVTVDEHNYGQVNNWEEEVKTLPGSANLLIVGGHHHWIEKVGQHAKVAGDQAFEALEPVIEEHLFLD